MLRARLTRSHWRSGACVTATLIISTCAEAQIDDMQNSVASVGKLSWPCGTLHYPLNWTLHFHITPMQAESPMGTEDFVMPTPQPRKAPAQMQAQSTPPPLPPPHVVETPPEEPSVSDSISWSCLPASQFSIVPARLTAAILLRGGTRGAHDNYICGVTW